MPFGQRYRQMRRPGRFGLGHNIRFGGRRRVSFLHNVTKNRFDGTIGPTTANVESLTNVALGVDSPTNRSTSVPNGAIIRSVIVKLMPTLVNGRHDAILFWRPGADDLATPIANYFDSADPLTEDGINMRRYALTRIQTYINDSTSINRPTFLRWKGARRIREGDQIIVALRDAEATTHYFQAWTRFSE